MMRNLAPYVPFQVWPQWWKLKELRMGRRKVSKYLNTKEDTWLLSSTALTGSVGRWWRSSLTSSPSSPATELTWSVSPPTPLRPTLRGSKLTRAREASVEVWEFHSGVILQENWQTPSIFM